MSSTRKLVGFIFMKELTMRKQIKEYLLSRYNRSKKYQESKGVVFLITEDEYFQLWMKKRIPLQKLERLLDRAILKDQPIEFKTNIVLSWKKDMARLGLPMSIETAGLYTFENSKINCRLRAGEKKTEAAKAKLRKPKSNTENMKGPKEPWSEERKAARAAAMAGKKRGKYNKKETN
ncbi:hypothetical protein ACF3NX_06455 [Acetobacter orientalis]|uniref:hypothetical protein n=1 Tax=Acetobacter orientalis TaxID=146474 RepID=UPI00386B4A6B